MTAAVGLGVSRPRVAVIGAGPAGLMAAETAARCGAAVTVYDRMPTVGRKFLLAGRGGLNITHSEPFEAFVGRYREAASALSPILRRWTPDDLRAWCAALGQPTSVGSSGRVFPAAFKTSPLLRAWLRRLDEEGVAFAPRHHWLGWDQAGRLLMRTPTGTATIEVEATVLALGGASWPQLGSDGRWVELLRDDGAAVAALAPANCGFAVAWSDRFRARFEGQPLKNIALRFGAEIVRGEVLVTRAGLEGGALYGLSGPLRDAVARDGEAILYVALKPDVPVAALATRWGQRSPKPSLATSLRKALHLSPVAAALLREVEPRLPARLAAMDPAGLAALVNAVPLRLGAARPIAEAISCAGGVRFAALDADLMLKHRPGTFVAGEMLDWEAPTGGYLLQACFATGAAAGAAALAWLDAGPAVMSRSAGPSRS